MLDNIDIAILTKVNELAERHGLRPTDFIATLRAEEGPSGVYSVLDYETGPSGNALREDRFDKMLRSLGIEEHDAGLSGSPENILDQLYQAIDIAPKFRGRL